MSTTRERGNICGLLSEYQHRYPIGRPTVSEQTEPAMAQRTPEFQGVNRRSLFHLGALAAASSGALALLSPAQTAAAAGSSPAVLVPPVDVASYLVRPATAARFTNPQRTMLATFQSGHGFSQAVTSGFNYNDTTDYVLGSQSAYIVTNGAGGQAILTKSAAVTGLNMTGKVFAILVKVTNSAHLSRLTLTAGSSGFASNFQIQVQASITSANSEITPEGRWSWVTLPWNPSYSAGAPDRTNITDLRITAVDDNTRNRVKVQVQAIAAQAERPAAFPNGVVSIGLDDCWGSQHTYATPYLDRYGYAPTVHAIVDLVGQPDRLTLDHLHRIEEYSGGEVAGHAWTADSHNAGFETLSPQTLDEELRFTKQWLVDNNFQGRDLFAYPLGHFNTSVMDATSKYFSYARTVNSRHLETLPPGGAMTCRARSINSSTTLADIKTLVDRAQNNGSWLNLLFHDITPGAPTDSVQVTTAVFQGAVDYLNARGIPVRTATQVLRATAT